MTQEDFSDRLCQIYERIAVATQRVGRFPDEITLVAVTKRQTTDNIKIALNAGLLHFGENYVQETVEKRNALMSPSCQWHLIGHLQSNKAKVAVKTFDLIHSVDSVRLARQISTQAEVQAKSQRILLQVHLGEEETKTGLLPDDVAEAAQEVLRLPGIRLQGLMGIAPNFEDARPHFRLLRRLFEALPTTARMVLSMGMTNDFETAIEEGTTMIRIGTALFGARPQS